MVRCMKLINCIFVIHGTHKSPAMTEKERKDTLKAIEQVKKKLKDDKVASRQFLRKVGIVKQNGKLTKAYGG